MTDAHVAAEGDDCLAEITCLQEARLLSWQRSHPLAETCYREVLSKDPDVLVARIGYALQLARQGKVKDAEAEIDYASSIDSIATTALLDAACEQDPHDVSLQGLVGLLWLKRGQPTRAAQLLRRALQLNPDNPSALTWAGQVWASLESQRDVLRNSADHGVWVPDVNADSAVRYLVYVTREAWLAKELDLCLAAARSAYERAGEASHAKSLALQCGLVWVGLTWTSSTRIAEDDRRRLAQKAIEIEHHDHPLRHDFAAHLLSHLTLAVVIGQRYPLSNLILNLTDADSRSLVKMIEGYKRLRPDVQCEVHARLAERGKGEMAQVVQDTLVRLLKKLK